MLLYSAVAWSVKPSIWRARGGVFTVVSEKLTRGALRKMSLRNLEKDRALPLTIQKDIEAHGARFPALWTWRLFDAPKAGAFPLRRNRGSADPAGGTDRGNRKFRGTRPDSDMGNGAEPNGVAEDVLQSAGPDKTSRGWRVRDSDVGGIAFG